MPHWFGRDIAASLPNARYVALRGGGHMLPETQTESLLELVTGFLGGGAVVALDAAPPGAGPTRAGWSPVRAGRWPTPSFATAPA